MKVQTHTVISGYLARDGKPRVFLKSHALPVPADEAFPEGTAVVIRDGKAVRP